MGQCRIRNDTGGVPRVGGNKTHASTRVGPRGGGVRNVSRT
jgi:hypothetical protein